MRFTIHYENADDGQTRRWLRSIWVWALIVSGAAVILAVMVGLVVLSARLIGL